MKKRLEPGLVISTEKILSKMLKNSLAWIYNTIEMLNNFGSDQYLMIVKNFYFLFDFSFTFWDYLKLSN